MKYLKISPGAHPIQQGESWWVVHPNRRDLEFCVPIGACAVCIQPFYHFNEGMVYEITEVNDRIGWITVRSSEWVAEMPFYVFARYFDAEAFLKGGIAKKVELKEVEFHSGHKLIIPGAVFEDDENFND